MAVILIAGTIPGLPLLQNGHTVHLISNTSKLWTTIAVLRPSLIIIDDKMENLNARKFCRDCKQNKNSQHIAIILLSDYAELAGYADAIIRRPFDNELVNATIEKVLEQNSLE